MKHIIKFCLPYLKKQMHIFIFYIASCCTAALFSYAIPLITGGFIDYLTKGVKTNDLYKYCTIFLLIVIGGLLVDYWWIIGGLLVDYC